MIIIYIALFLYVCCKISLISLGIAVLYNRIESKEQFEQLFRMHYSNLCAYANNFLKDVDAAEEVVQEILFKLWTNRESIEFTDSPKAYLYRAVRNASLNVLKHVNIREEYKAYNEQVRGNEMLHGEDAMMASELQERIRNAINGLPQARKEIFILSRYEGLSYKEIAEKLNLSVKTVENQMGSALKTLRTELADYLLWVILFFGEIFRNR